METIHLTKFQSNVLSVVDEFLSPDFDQFLECCRKSTPGLSNQDFAKEYSTLQFQLPRRQGSTTLCIEICKKYGGTIIVPNQKMGEKYKENGCVVCSINVIKQSGLFCVPDDVHKSLLYNRNIIMDIFRAYCGNSAVNQMFHELGRNYRFIIFR